MTRTCYVRTLTATIVCVVLALPGCGKKNADKPVVPGVNPPSPNKATPTPVADAGSDHLDMIPADATGFITMRVGDTWASDLAKKTHAELAPEARQSLKDFETKMGMSIGDVRRITIIKLSPNPDEPPLGIFTTSKPVNRKALKELMNPDAKEQTEDGMTFYPLKSKRDGVVYVADDHLFFFGPLADIKRVNKKSAAGTSGPLSAALGLVKDHAYVAAVNAAPLLKDVKQNPPASMKQFAPLMEAQTGTMTADVGTDLNLKVHVVFPGEDQAKKGETTLRGLVALGQLLAGQALAGNDQLSQKVQTAIQALDIKQQKDAVDLSVKANGEDLIAAVKTAVPLLTQSAEKVKVAAERTQASNNMKQIILAVHNFASTYQDQLPPPAVYIKDGKPLLSWRVLLLPYLEEDKLYREFKLNEPWDSEHNKKLLVRMPKVYSLPGTKQTSGGMTHFRTIGKFGPLAGQPKAGAGVVVAGTATNWAGVYSIATIPDGTSNTIFAVVADEAVPWTKPDAELDFNPKDPKSPLPRLRELVPGSFLVGMMDGSVRGVSNKVSEKTLRNAFCPNDGEVLGKDW